MDALDIRILRAMGIRPYERRPKHPDAMKPSHLAKAVDTTVVTVKERVARMEEAGILAGYQIYPNFRHLGVTAGGYFFQLPDRDTRRSVVDQMAKLEGLLELHDFLGGGVCADFVFAGPEDLASKLAFLSRCTGDYGPRPFYEREMPNVRRALTPLDWRILQALRGQAKKPLVEVAEAIGVSGRTVKRRYEAMAQEGSFFITPRIDASKAGGLILFELLFYLRPDARPETLNAILKSFDDRQVYTYRPASAALGNFDMLLFARNSGEIEELRRQGEAIAGVLRTEAWIFQGFFDYQVWLDEQIATRAAVSVPT
jgi:DNA-binding Lrp family transcriptional regulator